MVWLQRWCSCLSGKEGWVFGALRDWHQRPIGHLGQTVCLRCMHEHNMCVLSSWKNWRDLLRERNACGKPRTQPRCWPVKAWKCQSGPDSLSLISARRKQSIQRWESGLTVGNFTHQLLATPFLQLACTCHRCPQASHRGPCASRHFSCLPTCQETTFSAEEFRTLLLVRLHQKHMDARFCKCGELLDVYGHHR